MLHKHRANACVPSAKVRNFKYYNIAHIYLIYNTLPICTELKYYSGLLIERKYDDKCI